MRRYTMILTFVLLCTSLFASERMQVDLAFDRELVSLASETEGVRVIYQDQNMFPLHRSGAPDLPAFRAVILLPAHAEVLSVTAERSKHVALGKGIPAPVREYVIPGSARRSLAVPDPAIYKGTAAYPEDPVIRWHVGSYRGFRLLFVTLCPFSYAPETQQISLYEGAMLHIGWGVSKTREKDYPVNAMTLAVLTGMVRNPKDIARLYPNRAVAEKNKTDYDMLIVAADDLEAGAQNYATFRQIQAGVTSAVVSMSTIQAQYSGATVQLQIKNCVYDYVQNHNIAALLIIGDTDGTASYSVPKQPTYVRLDWVPTADDSIPADLFYSCFDDQFDWNANGDTLIGEMGVDNADIIPEIAVGRISLRTPAELAGFQQKMLAYQNAAGNETFIEEMLMVGIHLMIQGDAELIGTYIYNHYIAPFWTEHSLDTLWDTSDRVTTQDLFDALGGGYNLTNVDTHGSVDLWATTNGYFDVDDAADLVNTPGIIGTSACLTAAIDYPTCLAEAFIQNPDGGAVAYIGCARYGIGHDLLRAGKHDHYLPPSDHMNALAYEYLLREDRGHKAGEALMQSKILLAAEAEVNCSYRWLQFGVLLLGDPTMAMRTACPQNDALLVFDSVTLLDAGGNNDGTANPGEPITMQVMLHNLGNQAAENISATIAADSPYVTITDSSAQFPDIPAGGTGQCAGDSFAFTVADDAPDRQQLVFTLSWSADNGAKTITGATSVPLRVAAPVLLYDGNAIDDSAGNGNGRLDPGETAAVTLAVYNDGTANAPQAAGSLASDSPWITITQAQADFGDVSPSDSAYSQTAYQVTVAANCPAPMFIDCSLALTAGSYPAVTRRFSLAVGSTGSVLILQRAVTRTAERAQKLLEQANMAVTLEFTLDTDPATWSDYDMVLYSGGSLTTPVPWSMRDTIITYVENGGKLLIEGGEVACSSQDVQNGETFCNTVLHCKDFIYPLEDTLVVQQTDHPVAGLPFALPQEMGLSLWHYATMDLVKATDDATAVSAWANHADYASIIAYDNDNNPANGGQIVFLPFYAGRMARWDDCDRIILNSVSWLLGINDGHPVPVYRFFNPRTGAHLYTISATERDYILNNLPHYSYEGGKFAVHKLAAPGTVPCHRFFNTRTGAHLYTISEAERQYIQDNLPHYNYEGVKFYVHKTQQAGTTAVYRFFNTRTGAHLYTISATERDYILNNLPHYTYEGIKFYVYP